MTTDALVITVNVYKVDGSWWADSDDLFGLYVWEDTKSALKAAIPKAIEQVLEANGFSVVSVKERPMLPKRIRAKTGTARSTTTAYILENTAAAVAL